MTEAPRMYSLRGQCPLVIIFWMARSASNSSRTGLRTCDCRFAALPLNNRIFNRTTQQFSATRHNIWEKHQAVLCITPNKSSYGHVDRLIIHKILVSIRHEADAPVPLVRMTNLKPIKLRRLFKHCVSRWENCSWSRERGGVGCALRASQCS